MIETDRIDCMIRASKDIDDTHDEGVMMRAGMYELFDATTPICPHCKQRHELADQSQ